MDLENVGTKFFFSISILMILILTNFNFQKCGGPHHVCLFFFFTYGSKEGYIPLFRHLIGPTTHYSENITIFGLLRCRRKDTIFEFFDVSMLRLVNLTIVGLMRCRTKDTIFKLVVPTAHCPDISLFRHLIVPTAISFSDFEISNIQ